jgi:hypothetical protein
MEKSVGRTLRADDHRAALAKEKLMRDQRRLKAIMQRIKQSRKPDLHDQLHLTTAQYDVDLKNGYTHQLNGLTPSISHTHAHTPASLAVSMCLCLLFLFLSLSLSLSLSPSLSLSQSQ